MAGKVGVELSVEQQAIQQVGRALRGEADGKALRKELIGELKTAVEPGVAAVSGKLRSMPHTSAAQGRGGASGPPLGTYLAARVKATVRLSGRSTGVRVRIAQTAKLRGFALAARRLNRQSWRHRVFGGDVWVTQQSPMPEFFDQTLAAGKGTYRAAVLRALEAMARRIAGRA